MYEIYSADDDSDRDPIVVDSLPDDFVWDAECECHLNGDRSRVAVEM